jgi:hypothetical protein
MVLIKDSIILKIENISIQMTSVLETVDDVLRELMIDLARKSTSGVERQTYDKMMEHIRDLQKLTEGRISPLVAVDGVHPMNLFLVVFTADDSKDAIEITVEAVNGESEYMRTSSQRMRNMHFMRILQTQWISAVADHMSTGMQERLRESLLYRPSCSFTIVMNMSPYHTYDKWNSFPVFTLYAHHPDGIGVGNILFPGTSFFGEKHSPVKSPDDVKLDHEREHDRPTETNDQQSTYYGYVHSDRKDDACDVSVLGTQVRITVASGHEKGRVANLGGVEYGLSSSVNDVLLSLQGSKINAFISTGELSGYDMWLPLLLASDKHVVLIRDEIVYKGYPQERPCCFFRTVVDQFVDNVISKLTCQTKRYRASATVHKNMRLLAGILGTQPPVACEKSTITSNPSAVDLSVFATSLLQDTTYVWDYMCHCLVELVQRTEMVECAAVSADDVTSVIYTRMGMLRV